MTSDKNIGDLTYESSLHFYFYIKQNFIYNMATKKELKFVNTKTRAQALTANDGGIYFPTDSTTIISGGKEYGTQPTLSDIGGTVLSTTKGGTGATTLTTNAVLIGNSTSAVKTINTANGAFYATGSNLAPKFGILPPNQGGTGQVSTNLAANAFINALTEGTSDPKDSDYYVAQYAGGGTSTKTYHRKKHSSLWNYIKSKISSILGLDESNYKGKAATAGTADTATNAGTAATAKTAKSLINSSSKAYTEGNLVTPVCFFNGVPVAITHTVNDDVPANLNDQLTTLTTTVTFLLSYFGMDSDDVAAALATSDTE